MQSAFWFFQFIPGAFGYYIFTMKQEMIQETSHPHLYRFLVNQTEHDNTKIILELRHL